MRRPPACSRVNRGSARSLVRFRARLADRLISARERLLRGRLVEPVHVEPVVGPHQQRLIRQERHLVAVRRHTRHNGGRAVLLRGGVLPAGDPDARDESAQVPLPGARVRLVEVVQVDDQLALGRGVEAEVAQVRVPADDRRNPGRRQRRHVVGHHDRRAAQEPVWRAHHPSDPDRDQVRQPTLVRDPNQRNRIRAARRRLPPPERLARHLPPKSPAHREPLRPRRGPPSKRRERVALRPSQDGVRSVLGLGDRHLTSHDGIPTSSTAVAHIQPSEGHHHASSLEQQTPAQPSRQRSMSTNASDRPTAHDLPRSEPDDRSERVRSPTGADTPAMRLFGASPYRGGRTVPLIVMMMVMQQARPRPRPPPT